MRQLPRPSELALVGASHRALREATQNVGDLAGLDDIFDFCADLFGAMLDLGGVGLAANQLGLCYRVAVMFGAKGENVYLVDPIITLSGGTIVSREGCLSFPGLAFDVPRRTCAHVETTTRDGSRETLYLENFVAIVAQHEIDHLDGITLPTRQRQVGGSVVSLQRTDLVCPI